MVSMGMLRRRDYSEIAGSADRGPAHHGCTEVNRRQGGRLEQIIAWGLHRICTDRYSLVESRIGRTLVPGG
ncbi:hypothetical protein GCM10022226_43090 [Sphaerisporangium flaviroseum]|uniref:Uncharacterized protein n=1 Tax=Sphaerisporangium flaviroseum TaxID=509199 RepID=A0ABP7IGG1_9ACTN